MRKSLLRLYAPFLALAVVQAGFVAVAPSKGPDRTQQSIPEPNLGGDEFAAAPAPGADAAAPAAAGTADPGAALGGPAAATDAGTPTGGAPAASAGADSATAPVAGGTEAAGGDTTAAAPEGDTRHCRNGLQHDVTFYPPPCVAKWTGGENGGGTAQGVTDKEIKVVYFRERPNEQVDAILRSQGLASSEEELRAFYEAATDFLNARYEMYGRKIKGIRIVADCPQTPPDVPRCKEAARQVTALKPFAVIWGTPLYAEVFDEWSRAGILALGGWHFHQQSFTGRRPYRWDVVMDGTSAATAIGDYYCKKMAGGNASHSGRNIHPTIGNRGEVRRRVGITVPELATNVATARLLASIIQKCDPGAQAPVIRTYVSDINRAAEQTAATTAGYISEKVTTVICMCDPIAPAFGTKGFTSQGYFPEILMSGMGFADYDLVGRLYDPGQMIHAFGVSHLTEFEPFDRHDHNKVWRAAGRQGNACSTCGIPWGYMSLLGTMIQMSGPELNVANIERALLSLPGRGGDPYHYLTKLGPGDYTAISDAREAYWDPNAISPIDGRPGRFVGVERGRRYPIGQFPKGLDKIPVRD